MMKSARMMVATAMTFVSGFAAGPLLLGQEPDDPPGDEETWCYRCGPNSGCVYGYSTGLDSQSCTTKPGGECPDPQTGCGIA